MENEFLFLLMIGVVLSVLGSIFWWAFLIFGLVKGVKYYQRQFEQQLKFTEELQKQWANMSPQQQAAMQAQLTQAFGQLNQHYSQLNNIAKQRYDNRVGELMGMASSAGIDWHP